MPVRLKFQDISVPGLNMENFSDQTDWTEGGVLKECDYLPFSFTSIIERVTMITVLSIEWHKSNPADRENRPHRTLGSFGDWVDFITPVHYAYCEFSRTSPSSDRNSTAAAWIITYVLRMSRNSEAADLIRVPETLCLARKGRAAREYLSHWSRGE